METSALKKLQMERVTWFSMWFLGSVASFGAAFFPMFYRLVDSRNKHFRREADLERQIAEFLKKQGKQPPQTADPSNMNAKAWAASIIVVIPVFFILYYLSKDLFLHETA